MLKSSPLARKRIANGVYEGVYKGQKTQVAAPALTLSYMGEIISDLSAEPLDAEENTWIVRGNIPTQAITDGIQTFLLCRAGENTVLDSFSVVAGASLDDDLRHEINLLRAELDMLKRAFRRHCVETM
ncbi:MAG: hypothetical protein IME92_00220 [Proteobacteria bacterium]|nr:hypothetical protein [Pseudomonadota bacterium]